MVTKPWARSWSSYAGAGESGRPRRATAPAEGGEAHPRTPGEEGPHDGRAGREPEGRRLLPAPVRVEDGDGSRCAVSLGSRTLRQAAGCSAGRLPTWDIGARFRACRWPFVAQSDMIFGWSDGSTGASWSSRTTTT